MGAGLQRYQDPRGVLRLTLDRPERHNALDGALIDELARAFNEDAAGARVVILTGNGASFCAGADLRWMCPADSEPRHVVLGQSRALAGMMKALNNCPVPVIGHINGSAFGGGVGLVACCDIVIARRDTVFCLSEVRLGLVASVIAPYVLAAIGTRQARRLFLNAERFNAREARRIGLVHYAVEAQELDDVVAQQVDALLKGGPRALAACKHNIAQLCPPPDDSQTAELITRLRLSEEGREGMSAFLEKRKPAWIPDET